MQSLKKTKHIVPPYCCLPLSEDLKCFEIMFYSVLKKKTHGDSFTQQA